ncbi:hypothetical protein RUND412_003469 [Rhizina undulata]
MALQKTQRLLGAIRTRNLPIPSDWYILSNSQLALRSLNKPAAQSGQAIIHECLKKRISSRTVLARIHNCIGSQAMRMWKAMKKQTVWPNRHWMKKLSTAYAVLNQVRKGELENGYKENGPTIGSPPRKDFSCINSTPLSPPATQTKYTGPYLGRKAGFLSNCGAATPFCKATVTASGNPTPPSHAAVEKSKRWNMSYYPAVSTRAYEAC